MRCYCCNKNLSDAESVLKHPDTGEYLDMCRKCLQDIPIEPVESDKFLSDDTIDDFDFVDDLDDEE